MFGLAYLIFFAMYLLASLAAVILAAVWAGRRKRSRLLWGGVAALLMYNLVFWDWLPTVYVHKYYCEKESGFLVYKTLEQWKVENPGAMERLVAQRSVQSTSYGDLQTLDERFAIETHRSRPIPLITTNIAERQLVDRKTGEVLAKGVDVGSGVGNMMTGGGLKFWLNQRPCISQEIWSLTTEIQNMRGTK